MSRRGRLLLISIVVAAVVVVAVLFHSRGNGAGNLIALDARTGRQVWRSHVPAAEFIRVSDTGGPVNVATWAQFGKCDFGEIAFTVDNATGQVLGKPMRVKEADDIELSDGGVHFSAARSPALLNVTASSQPGGALLWRRTVGKADLSAGSGVLVLNNENLTDFSILDARTGKTLWVSRAPLTLAVPGSGDGRVYLVTAGHVQAVDSRTGVAQWRAPAIPGKDSARLVPVIASSPALVAVEQGDRLGVYGHSGHRLYTTAFPGGWDPNLFVGSHRIYVGRENYPTEDCD